MLDDLYENIGEKIKNCAKRIFIVETICAIIMGLLLLFTNLILLGFVVLVCGPVVAWVSTWILYAFGELVEDVHAIRIRFQNQVLANTHTSPTPVSEKVEGKFQLNSSVGLDSKNRSDWNSIRCANGYIEGPCQMCGAEKQELVNIEFEDFFGKARRDMCYSCFCKHNPRTKS